MAILTQEKRNKFQELLDSGTLSEGMALRVKSALGTPSVSSNEITPLFGVTRDRPKETFTTSPELKQAAVAAQGAQVSPTIPKDLDRFKLITTGAELPPQIDIQQLKTDVSAFARPILQSAGSILGGAAGVASPVPGGGVVGGALGFAGGDSLADLIDRGLGLKEPPATPIAAVGEAVKSIQTGFQQEFIGIIPVKIGAEALKAGAKLTSKALPAIQKVIAKAESLGIPLSFAEISNSKVLGLLESVLDKTPFSAGLIQKFRLKQLDGLIKERNRLISETGDPEVIESLGIKVMNELNKTFTKQTNLRKETAQKLRDNLLEKLGSINDFKTIADDVQSKLASRINSIVKQGNTKFELVGKLVNESEFVPGTEMRKVAVKILKEERNLPVGEQDQKLIQTLVELSGEGLVPAEFAGISDVAKDEIVAQTIKRRNWLQINALRKNFDAKLAMFDEAVKSGVADLKGFGSETGGKFKRLSGAIRRDMDIFAETKGGEILKAHNEAKQFWKEWVFNTARKPIIKKFLLNEGTEKFVQTFFTPGDQTNIRVVKKALGPKLFEESKQSFVKKVLESNDIGKFLDKFGDDTLKEIFTKGQLRKLKGADELIKRNLTGVEFEGIIVDDPFFKVMMQSLKKAPEKIVDMIVRPNNVGSIKKVKNILGEESFTGVKVAFLEKVMETNKFGFFSPAKFTTMVNKYGDETLKELLGNETFKGLKELGEVALKVQGAERLAGNPSGTAQNIISAAGFGALFINPILGTKIAVTWNMLGRLYTSDSGRKMVLKAIQTPLSSKLSQIGRWQQIIERAAVAGLTVSVSDDNFNDSNIPIIARTQTGTQ